MQKLRLTGSGGEEVAVLTLGTSKVEIESVAGALKNDLTDFLDTIAGENLPHNHEEDTQAGVKRVIESIGISDPRYIYALKRAIEIDPQLKVRVMVEE